VAAEEADSETESKTVFIVGVPRSGTTWTMMLLAQHPRITVLQQSGLLHALQPLRKWWQSTGGYGKRVVSSSGLSDTFVGDLLESFHLNAFCTHIVQHVYDRVRKTVAGSSVVVDQTPENLEFAEWILQLLPDAYFLHVVRDPRAVYASMRAATATWASAESFPHHPEAVGAMWLDYAMRVKDLKQQTDRVKEVRYEDMINDGHVQLSSIFSWLDLEFDSSVVEKALQDCSMEKMRQASVAPQAFLRKGKATGWRDEVSRSQAACVEYNAHPLMGVYDYALTSDRPDQAPLPARVRASAQRIIDPVIERIKPARDWAKRLAGR
jgi:hypothetical protein